MLPAKTHNFRLIFCTLQGSSQISTIFLFKALF